MMSTNNEPARSLHATAAETVDVSVTRTFPDHDANRTGLSESIGLDDASVTEFLSRPENFVLDADFIDSMHHPDRFYEHNQISSDEFDTSCQHSADDQHGVYHHPQSEFHASEYSMNQPLWSQTPAIQPPEYDSGQTWVSQSATTQTLNSGFAPDFVPSNNGLYFGTTVDTRSPLSLDNGAGNNSQLASGRFVPCQNAFEHQPNTANFPLYSSANVLRHQNELESFFLQQPLRSEGMGHLVNGQGVFPHQNWNPNQNQNWNDDFAFSTAVANHNDDMHTTEQFPMQSNLADARQSGQSTVSAESPAVDVADGVPQVEGCGRSRRKPAGRKGRPRPKTYNQVEEAIIVEGMHAGASFADIGEELGRPGQAVEHKIRRMKAEGKM